MHIWLAFLHLLFFAQSIPMPGPGMVAGGGAAALTFITSQTPGSLRNDYSDCVGISFTPSSNMHITAIGRLMILGNIGTHTLYVQDGAAGTQLSTASVSMIGTTVGTWKYASITPLALTSGTKYAVTSLEANLGDQWYDNDTAVTSSADFSRHIAVFDTATCTTIAENGSVGNGYVTTNFQYTIP